MYINTGSMYRAVALSKENNIKGNNIEELCKLIDAMIWSLEMIYF